MNLHHLQKHSGFSLVEMAVVLTIIGLLMAGLLLPLTAQMDQRNYNETQTTLRDLRESLIGYALSTPSKPYLPCPDTDGDGRENRVGPDCVEFEGDVPWATLGLGQVDSWKRRFRYRVARGFEKADTGFTLMTEGDVEIRDSAGGASSLLASKILEVLVSKGKYGEGSGVDESENSNMDHVFVSRPPTTDSGNEFDDLVVWLPATILFNRMVSAGRLP